MAAVEWLSHNHSDWIRNNVNLEDVRSNLCDPVLIDRSTTVNGSDAESDPINSNIEKSETFQVYFPDGSASAVTGGQENVEKFKDLIRQMKPGSFDIEFQCDLQREAVSDFKDNN
jgi:hypothetical protein